MAVEIIVPTEFHGNVLGQITKRNGIVTSTESVDEWSTINAEVPLNEMFGYAGELRSHTQGKGEFTMEYCRYSPCKPDVQQRVVEKYQESLNIVTPDKKKKRN